MKERSSQVHKVLATLSRHADLISEALDGTVSSHGDKDRRDALNELANIKAVKAYEEDKYRLNPRLKGFFSDYFASYQAFEALHLISGTINQAFEQWRGLCQLTQSGSLRDQSRLAEALESSIDEIAYTIEHNLAMLHVLLVTKYGNVDSFQAKKSQNKYYLKQVNQFLIDTRSIDLFVEEVFDQAINFGLMDVRKLVAQRLHSNLLAWTSQIKDAQVTIDKRLFEMRALEEKLKLLAAFSLWLTRTQTESGWDLPISNDVPLALCRPEPIAIRCQPDVTDSHPSVMDALIQVAQKMPPESIKSKKEETEVQVYYLTEEEDEAIHVVDYDEFHQAMRGLLDEIEREPEVSLLSFKRKHNVLSGISDEVWLICASQSQYIKEKATLSYVPHPETENELFPINEVFCDIRVSRRTSRGANGFMANGQDIADSHPS